MIPVTLVVPEGANPITTDDELQFQFVIGGLPPRNRPKDDGWTAGRWITRASGQVLATINVGPGGDVALAPGRWAAWIRVVDNPTIPVQAVDQLTIT